MVSGLVLYDIELDGCLNGVYTNDHAAGLIYNEIARRRPDSPDGDLSGIYDCFYFDENNSRNNAVLTISRIGRTYHLEWRTDSRIIFNGVGYIMNEKQLVVHYWDL